MKKYLSFILALMMVGMLAGCGNSQTSQEQSPSSEQTSQSEENDTPKSAEEETADSNEEQTDGKALAAYFAYSENVGDTGGMELDAIASASLNEDTNNTEGNLQVMAQIIKEEKGADIFSILMTDPYPIEYSEMLPIAIEQMQNEERPALQSKIENLENYDMIYLGVPVWNSSLPPAMQTFFAENDLSGKTIIPFGIHLGSGFGRMLDEMEGLAPGANIQEGFTISARTANDEVENEFRAWLNEQSE